MTAPMPNLLDYSVSRSGASVTVRCWMHGCAEPIVFRGRSISLLGLIDDVNRHWQVLHRVADDERALREVGAVGEQLAMLRKSAAEHGISL